jgi:type VI secretion system protein ImpB
MLEDNALSAPPPLLSRPLLREGTEQLVRYTLFYGTPPVPLPQLNKLRELRDALVALKGPLAEKPGLRESIERDFFNDEVDDRVLGKRVSRPLDIYRPGRRESPSGW